MRINVSTACFAFAVCILLYAMPLRAEEDYEPIVAGGFLLMPKLTLEQRYSDNVHASDEDKESDYITAVKPSLLIEKKIRDHEFSFENSASIQQYWENSDDSTIDFKSEFRGRAVARRVLTLPFKVSYESGHLERADERGSLTREPTGFKKLKTELGAEYAPGRLMLGLYGGYNETWFENGQTRSGVDVIRDDGDYETVYGRGVIRYTTGTEWTPFVSLMYGENTYDNNPVRDNNVTRAMFGAEVDYHDLFYGSAAFGHDWRSYDAAGVDDVEALSAEGNLELRLHKRTKFMLDFLRQSEEDNVLNDGIVETDIRLANEYELFHHLYLNTGTHWRNTKFEGTDREDDIYAGSIGLSYDLNRKVVVGAEYLHRWRDSTAEGSDFDENAFMLRLTGKF